MASLKEEISRRMATFAIISHPDAGKTTLTEKFLLYGGAINLAGSVKGKSNSPACGLRLDGDREGARHFRHLLPYCSLTTTGTASIFWIHRDIRTSREDTYRTLMAADSAVMVIDAAKGIEAQTRKLFKVCAMRDIPDLYLYQ